jgi:hypothetical protein
VAHPCTNEQVKHANDMILQDLKPHILTQESEDVHIRLNTQAGRWAAEVPSVLWSLWTIPNRSTGFTPFCMVYGAEAVLPTDLQYGSPRIQAYLLNRAEKARQDVVDLLKESRDTAVIRSTRYQQALQRYHAHRVYPRAFQIGDLVLRWIQTKKGKHKLSPALGGTLLDSRDTPTRGVQIPGNQWHNLPNCLEHRAAKEVLPMTLSFLLCLLAVIFFCGYLDGDGRTMTGMWEDAGVRKSVRVSSRPRGVSNRGGEALSPCKTQ